MTAHPWNEAGRLALEIYRRVLVAVAAETLTERALRQESLASAARVRVAGVGKAAVGMAQGLLAVLGDRVDDALIVTKHGHGRPLPGVRVLEAGHPVPDATSLAAGAALLDFARESREGDLVIFLLSGGASALAEALVPSVDLAELQARTASWLASGMDIVAVNRERTALSQVKGGGLARAFARANVLVLVLSDVLGNPLASIGSGPFVPPQGVPAHVRHVVVGDLSHALRAAEAAARDLGLAPEVASAALVGEARELGARLGARRPPPGSCLIFGGEPTVTLDPSGRGRGGRAQELALAASLALQGVDKIALLAGSTDGTDGPTDAAGALVDGGSLARGQAAGLDAGAYLDRHDAYAYHAATGGLIVTGPTHSNVNDLVLVVTEP